ncbi:hypothetical protein DPX16_1184, partial [Anabarilius grahami]
RSFPGLTHVVAERNRMLSNQALVDFIVARGTDNHIQKVPVPLFIEDQEQIDVIYTHLTSILDSTPTHTQ